MSENVLTLAPGSQPLNQSLGFGAASVVVDNVTSSYVQLPDTGKAVPPWVYGAVVALPRGINRARAKLLATVPAVAGPPVPAELAVCTMTWTDVPLPPSAGHLLQQSQYAQQSLVAEVTGAGGAVVGPKTFPVPAGTMSIGFLVRLDASRSVPQQVTIRGTQSQQSYVTTSTVLTTGGAQWFPFGSAIDTSVDVTMTAALGTSAIDVLASPLVEAIDVQETAGRQLPVILEDNATGVAITTQPSPTGGGPSLGVSLFDATPAPWQAPRSKLVSSSTTLAATYKQILAAVGAGVQLYLFWAYFVLDAASGGVFAVGSDGATANIFVTNDNGKGPYVVGPLAGEPQGLNSGLFVFTTSPATVRYHVAYTAL